LKSVVRIGDKGSGLYGAALVAIGGNQRQIESVPKPRQQANTFAVGCDLLPFGAHRRSGRTRKPRS
jgi:hypothetical protein